MNLTLGMRKKEQRISDGKWEITDQMSRRRVIDPGKVRIFFGREGKKERKKK
jgi:hypothetical protein